VADKLLPRNLKIKTKIMENQNHEEKCSQCGSKPKKQHRQVFNADFLFILITAVVLNVYALTYTYALFG